MITFEGVTYDWIDHQAGLVLDMHQISALVAQPRIEEAGDDDVLKVNIKSRPLSSKPVYYRITLSLITVPGQAADVMLPGQYATAEEAMLVAEKCLLSERQRLRDLFDQ